MRTLLVIVLIIGAMSIVGTSTWRNAVFIREVRRIRSAVTDEPDKMDTSDEKLVSIEGYNAPGRLAPPIPLRRRAKDRFGPSPWMVHMRSLHMQGPLENRGSAL